MRLAASLNTCITIYSSHFIKKKKTRLIQLLNLCHSFFRRHNFFFMRLCGNMRAVNLNFIILVKVSIFRVYLNKFITRISENIT